jgi:chorismate mutase
MNTQDDIVEIRTLRNRLSGLERKLKKAISPERRAELGRRIAAAQKDLDAARRDHFGSAESVAAVAK